MHPADIQAAITGKVSCHPSTAGKLLNWIIENRANGVTPAGENHFVDQYAENHDIGPDDLALIKEQANALAANGKSAPTTISAADLYEMKVEPPTWIIPGVLPAGLSILAGKPKAGKSWLALDLAIAAAAGGSLFGEMDCEQPCDVLYLALEDTDYRLQERMKRLLCGDKPPARLQFSTEWPAADQGGLDHLASWVKAQDRPGLVIIDTLQKIRPATKKSSGIYESDYAALTPLKKLADEHKIAVVLVHHVRKQKANDPQEMISGSYGLTGAADTNIVLQRDHSTSNASLYLVGRDVGESDYALMFDKDLGRWQLLGDCALPATTFQQEILAAIKNQAMKPCEIAEAVGSTAKSVSNTLGKMHKKLMVTKAGYGKYIATATYQEQAL